MSKAAPIEAQLVGSDLLKEGWLVKEAVGKGGNWKSRYFIFRNNGLYYYEDKPKSYDKPKGIIEISAKTIVRPAAVQKKFAFEVCTGPIVLRVRAANQMECNQWMAVVRDAVDVLGEASGPNFKRDHKQEGFLVKRAMGTGRNWKKRWFVLKGGRLAYYEDRPTPGANDKPKGVMELTADSSVSVYKEGQSVKPFTFELKAKKLVLTASCDSAMSLAEWVDAIDLQILAKSGIVTPGPLEVAKWLRMCGLQEYARRMVEDCGWDELCSVYDSKPADVGKVALELEMTRLEADALEEAVKILKKNKKPKSHKAEKQKPEPKKAHVLFNFEPPGGPKTNRLYTWGDSSDGRLGLVEARTGASTHTPAWCDALKGKSEVVSVSCGLAAMGAVTKDFGNIFTWGTGPLGLGNDKITSSRPFMMISLREIGIKQLSCGGSHMVCLSKDGNVFAWGAGDSGQLGQGEGMPGCGDPLQMPQVGLHAKLPVASVCAGPEQTLLVTTSGLLYVCGENKDGQLGLPETTKVFYPTRVKALESTPIGQCAVASKFAVCVSKTGSGAYWFGKLLKSKTITPPERIPRFTNRPISFCAASRTTALFLVGLSMDTTTKEYSTDSSVYSVGSDLYLLGHGDDEEKPLPVLIEGLEGHGAVQIAISPTHAGCVTQDGRVLMWGKDSSGQLGSSYMASCKRPAEAISISGFKYTALAVGEGFSAALCSEDDSKLIPDVAKGNPGPPPPPTDEALQAAEKEDDDVQDLLNKLAVFNHKYDMMNNGDLPPSDDEEDDAPPPPPDDDDDAPPPPPDDEEEQAPKAKTGGKRVLPPGSTDLGNGWISHLDKVSNKHYYEQPSTGKVQWTAPTTG